MNTKAKGILVTGGRSPVALNLIRILHNNGYKVYVVESESYNISKKSNAVEKSFIVPKPNENHRDFIKMILHYCLKYNIGLIIPTCEEIFHIAKEKVKFENNLVKVFCDDIEKLRLLHNKYNFINFLKERGYLYPKTHQFTSVESITGFLAHCPLNEKMVLKAVYSRFASNVSFVKNGDILRNINISSDNPWVLQEYIKGTQYCSYSIAIEGELVAHTCYPTIYTAGLGANVFFKHIHEPEIEDFVERVVKDLNYTGQIAFDFIKDEKGHFYPIECNPRATSGLHLFNDVQSFGFLFLQPTNFKGKEDHINRNPLQKTYPFTQDSYRIGLPMLSYGITEGFLFRKPFVFLKDFIKSKDVLFSIKDIKPYFYQFFLLAVMLKRKMKSGKSLTELTTTDIDWDGK